MGAQDEALEALISRFLDRSLPQAEWTHAAHLSVGLWMVHHHGVAEAGARMRPAIRAYNEATGVGNGPGHGYHETITLAWLALLDQFLAQAAPAPLAARCAAFLAGPWAARDALLRFYRRETLLSPTARQAWVEPDLAPIRLAALTEPV